MSGLAEGPKQFGVHWYSLEILRRGIDEGCDNGRGEAAPWPKERDSAVGTRPRAAIAGQPNRKGGPSTSVSEPRQMKPNPRSRRHIEPTASVRSPHTPSERRIVIW